MNRAKASSLTIVQTAVVSRIGCRLFLMDATVAVEEVPWGSLGQADAAGVKLTRRWLIGIGCRRGPASPSPRNYDPRYDHRRLLLRWLARCEHPLIRDPAPAGGQHRGGGGAEPPQRQWEARQPRPGPLRHSSVIAGDTTPKPMVPRPLARTHTSGLIERIPLALTVERPCENELPHSGYRHLADKDEAAGSSPARPTNRLVTSGNAGH